MQFLPVLLDLMTRNRFESINTFFHIVTSRDEEENADDPLKKVRPFYDHVKAKCAEFYQPLQELSVDERMVKSKARTQFRQYIRNKPTKWGFKFWVLSDPTGYTCDYNMYCGRHRSSAISENGLAHDVVMELVTPFARQGYNVFFDNFYTSPALLHTCQENGLGATGTLNTNRRGVPVSVKQLQQLLNKGNVERGTGYYVRDNDDVYVCWKDNKCVCVASNCYPGHSTETVRRRSKTPSGQFVMRDLPLPSAVSQYNKFMGGVDKSDQLIGYHRVVRQTKKYWKTIMYHLLEICITNAAIICKWRSMENGSKPHTMGHFRDAVIQGIIAQYPIMPGQNVSVRGDFIIRHGSTPFEGQRKRCALCGDRCSRQCPDCPFTPPLCQSLKKKCHEQWHSAQELHTRAHWFLRCYKKKMNTSKRTGLPKKRPGRPKSSKDKKKRTVN